MGIAPTLTEITWTYLHPTIEDASVKVTWYGATYYWGEIKVGETVVASLGFGKVHPDGFTPTPPEAATWASEWAETVGLPVIERYKLQLAA